MIFLIKKVPWLERLDRKITATMAKYGIPFSRLGMGIVFVWFGALKFFPGLSPAEGLVRETIFFIDPDIFLPLLAVWEVLIGLGMISFQFTRLTVLLLILHMPGTFLPLVILPSSVWTQFPFGLTLEGQYIIKNLVIIGASFTILGMVREGENENHPPHTGEESTQV